MAQRIKELAISKYGCKEFTSLVEGKNEIAISYWDTEDQIKEWKNDTEHLAAQEMGKSKWYKSYSVQIVKVTRQYEGSS